MQVPDSRTQLPSNEFKYESPNLGPNVHLEDPSKLLEQVGLLVENETLIQKLRRRILFIVNGIEPNSDNIAGKLPGPLPIAIHKDMMQLVRESKYWVTAKFDGVRYMLFCSQRNSYLVDRTFKFRRFHSSFYNQFADGDKETLLDGEVVWKGDFQHATPVGVAPSPLHFIPFDICMSRGIPLSNKPFKVRLPYLNDFGQQCSAKDPKALFSTGLPLLLKSIVPVSQIKKLQESMKRNDTVAGAHGWIYTDPKGYVTTCDGFVMMHPEGDLNFNDPVLPSKKLLKWKGDNTIDLCAQFRPGPEPSSVRLFYHARQNPKDKDKKEPEKEIALGTIRHVDPATWELLNSSLPKKNDSGGGVALPVLVVECSFPSIKDPNTWKILKVRTDKQTPNHANVVEDTISVIEEDISLDSLISQVLDPSPSPGTVSVMPASAPTTAPILESKSHLGKRNRESTTGGQQKRPATGPISHDPNYSVYFTRTIQLVKPLIQRWLEIKDSELEGRIFKKDSSGKASQGVNKELFDKIIVKLRAQKCHETRQETIDYNYVDGTRVTDIVSEGGNKRQEIISKKMLYRQDVEIHNKGWGFRIQLKTESPAPRPPGLPITIRKKQRLSFFNPKKEFSFDLTTVRSGQSEAEASRAIPTYELEIEALRNSGLQQKQPSLVATSLVMKLLDWLDEKPNNVITRNDPDDNPIPPPSVPIATSRKHHPHSPKRGGSHSGRT